MKKVVVYGSSSCPFTIKALHLLKKKDIDFNYIEVDGNPDLRQEMAKKAGKKTVPQIWIDEYHVGGCDELYELDITKKLDELLDQKK